MQTHSMSISVQVGLVLPCIYCQFFYLVDVRVKLSWYLTDVTAVPPAIRRWWPGHLSTGFPRDILHGSLGIGLPEERWKVGDSGKSLGKRPRSHGTLSWVATNTHSASDIFTHALCELHQSFLNVEFAKWPDDTFGDTIGCLFQIDKSHVQCRVDGKSNVECYILHKVFERIDGILDAHSTKYAW